MGRFFHQLYAPDQHVGAMRAFGSMGAFCGARLPLKWDHGQSGRPPLPPPKGPFSDGFSAPGWCGSANRETGLVSHFLDWLDYVETNLDDHRESFEVMFAQTPLTRGNWKNVLASSRQVFQQAVAQWREDYDKLLEAWNASEHRAQANSLRYQLMTLFNLTVIEAMADARFLPRYGFPIGVHKLRVVVPDEKGRARTEDQYRLERPGLLALREYVPGSQLLVGGKLVTSHGMLKHWSGANLDQALGMRGGATTCSNKHFHYWYGSAQGCPQCGEKPQQPIDDLLFPAHGFTTAAWDPPRRSSDIERVGKVITGTAAFATRTQGTVLEEEDFAGVAGVKAIYKEEADILVFNKGEHDLGFAVCTACGYADSEKNPPGDELPSRFDQHLPLHKDKGSYCWSNETMAPVIRHQVLAAREPTDLLMLDLRPFLERDAADHRLNTSLAVALHLAGARLLSLDSRELGHMVVRMGKGWAPVIYDNVPGGAGLVQKVMGEGREWLEATQKLLYVDEAHHERCRTACLDCLMTFDAQMHFVGSDDEGLDRRAALDVVERMLDRLEPEPDLPPELLDADPDCHFLLKQVPTPIVGYEFVDGIGRVQGEVELAWEEQQVCLAMDDQEGGRKAAEQAGWVVYGLGQSAVLIEHLNKARKQN